MRLQLHRNFTFADAAAIVPYLAAIGVSHLYSSPILTARAGSMHGYDVTDPTRVNPELGGEDGLRDLVAALRRAGLGLIVDIVPNHMAVGGADNAWWTDVLRHGPSSRYASYFDIDWDINDPLLRGKVLAPFLGKPYGQALADGDIAAVAGSDGRVEIHVHGTPYPLRADEPTPAVARLDGRTASGRAALHALLERQHYRLAWWGTAGDDINWRRFFDINGLAGLRIEAPEVFEATHATLFRLYAEGLIDGFRVDHVDGLSDPPGYCRRLRARLDDLSAQRPPGAPPGSAWLVIEKILGVDETLPKDWGVDGTSGYDFMDTVSALQHDPDARPALEDLWSSVSGRPASFVAEETAARREILDRNFDAQLRFTAAGLRDVARADIVTRDTTEASIRRGLTSLLAHFPVYRTYGAGASRSAGDQRAFDRALRAAKAEAPASLIPTLARLDRWLGGEAAPDDSGRAAVTRFQQLSAPIAAKAVEDTAFYRYGRLLSRNDVGFDAALMGIDAAEFHAACAARLADFPDAMLTTATHDHKRGEDVRARLAVLSEIPEEWARVLRGWLHHVSGAMPSAGDAAMLFQMIVGAWPSDLPPDDTSGVRGFATRLAGWQEKALREAKLRTDWAAPNAEYEAAARSFLDRLLTDQGFLREATAFIARIAPAGAVNGLAQTLLKLTAPGVPDFFQGTEFWDFSLVDPDNRRSVDFGARITALRGGDRPETLVPETPVPETLAPEILAKAWRDGRVKQAVIARTLALRHAYPALFARGAYCPVQAVGDQPHRIVSFRREGEGGTLLVVVPRLAMPILEGGTSLRFAAPRWGNTRLDLGGGGRVLRDVFTGQEIPAGHHSPEIAAVLADFPVALFHAPATG
jgi:(1->4)-alpha-D-glucan 1-alpha-D-glucosylmutase